MAEDTMELDAQSDLEEGTSRNELVGMNELTAGSIGKDGLDDEMAADALEDRRLKPTNQFVPMSELRKVRAEAAKYRKRLRQLESTVKEEKKATELAKMEETDRLRTIAEEAQIRLKILKKRANAVAKQAAVINAASAMGFYNPKDAASIIDLELIEVDDGIVDEERIGELVKSLAECKPYLIRENTVGGVSASPGGFGPTNPPSGDWPKPKLRSRDQVDRLKQQSRESMKNGRLIDAVKLYNQAWEMDRNTKRKQGG